MRILVTGFDWLGDLVPFVVRALSGMDHVVSVVSTNPDTLVRQNADLLKRLNDLPLAGKTLAGRWHSRLARGASSHVGEVFRAHVDEFQPDVVLSILCWGEPLTADVLAHASRATKIGWLMDDPFGYPGSRLEQLLTGFDLLFTVDDGWSSNVERMTGTRPVWLTCGADPASHRPLDSSKLDPSLSGHVVYVGSSCADHPAGTLRRHLIESLAGLPLAIFGDDGWAGYGGAAAAAYRSGPVSSDEANVIYASGAIALNLHHPQFQRGTSLRTFALCCSGAFQLADWREGIDRWLTPGLEIEVFRTPGELRTLVERYLRDHPARARIAAAGRARVIAEHTYFHRLAKMLEDVRAVSAA